MGRCDDQCHRQLPYPSLHLEAAYLYKGDFTYVHQSQTVCYWWTVCCLTDTNIEQLEIQMIAGQLDGYKRLNTEPI